MGAVSFFNGIVELNKIGAESQASLHAAPIGVNDGKHLLGVVLVGVVLEPLSYERLVRLAIPYRQHQSGDEPHQTKSDALATFIDMGERLLSETSGGVTGHAHSRSRPNHGLGPDDVQEGEPTLLPVQNLITLVGYVSP